MNRFVVVSNGLDTNQYAIIDTDNGNEYLQETYYDEHTAQENCDILNHYVNLKIFHEFG